MGLVSQVFDESTLDVAPGPPRDRPRRYSTTGASIWENAQPTFRPTADGSIALGHNGNLINTGELAQLVDELPGPAGELAAPRRAVETARPATPTWSPRCSPRHPDRSLEQRGARGAAAAARRLLASSSWTSTRCTPPATRRASARWCSAGSSAAGSSPRENAALDIVGASVVREVEPGELIAIDEHGLRSHRFAEPDPKGCLFEYVYLARPDTTIAGRSVHAARVEMGRRLAREHPVEADLVIPVPESGTPGRGRLRRGVAASRSARAWSRTPTSAAPSSSPVQTHPPARHPAQAQPAARRDPRASGSSSSTTRSCAATPSARWSGCCARPAPPRSTCGSPRRR